LTDAFDLVKYTHGTQQIKNQHELSSLGVANLLNIVSVDSSKYKIFYYVYFPVYFKDIPCSKKIEV
jgi:hypothetical protein